MFTAYNLQSLANVCASFYSHSLVRFYSEGAFALQEQCSVNTILLQLQKYVSSLWQAQLQPSVFSNTQAVFVLLQISFCRDTTLQTLCSWVTGLSNSLGNTNNNIQYFLTLQAFFGNVLLQRSCYFAQTALETLCFWDNRIFQLSGTY